ncbi:MAG: hypothetical protein CM1200mP30_16690 [Pseudomonadota bacterium]|nr:MAG: hypothetical protein CM1200mP30_16690 [Pseudomonadota bacterium]
MTLTIDFGPNDLRKQVKKTRIRAPPDVYRRFSSAELQFFQDCRDVGAVLAQSVPVLEGKVSAHSFSSQDSNKIQP